MRSARIRCPCLVSSMAWKAPTVDPSRAEIRKLCEEIQLRWSPDEKRRRCVYQVEPIGVVEVEFDDELAAEW